MNSSPRRRPRPTPQPQPSSRRYRPRSGAASVLLCGLLYALTGWLVTALPDALWVWPIALIGSWFQILELTRFSPEPQLGKLPPHLWLLLFRVLGVGALTLSLAVALNYLGTDQLDDLTPWTVLGQVLGLSLLALLLALLCRLTTARLGERLKHRLKPWPRMRVLGMASFLGLALGGTVGVLGP